MRISYVKDDLYCSECDTIYKRSEVKRFNSVGAALCSEPNCGKKLRTRSRQPFKDKTYGRLRV